MIFIILENIFLTFLWFENKSKIVYDFNFDFHLRDIRAGSSFVRFNYTLLRMAV